MLTLPLMLTAASPDSVKQSTFLYDLGITIEPARESAPLQGIGVANPHLVRIQNQIDSLSRAFSYLTQRLEQMRQAYDTLQAELLVLQQRVLGSPYATLTDPPIIYRKTEGDNFFKKGTDAYNARHYQVAIEYFQKVIASDLPRAQLGDAYYWIGDCYLQLHDEYLALEYFKKLAEFPMASRVADAFYLTGIIYRKLGEDKLAMTFFQRIIKRFPNSKYAKLAQLELQRMPLPHD